MQKPSLTKAIVIRSKVRELTLLYIKMYDKAIVKTM